MQSCLVIRPEKQYDKHEMDQLLRLILIKNDPSSKLSRKNSVAAIEKITEGKWEEEEAINKKARQRRSTSNDLFDRMRDLHNIKFNIDREKVSSLYELKGIREDFHKIRTELKRKDKGPKYLAQNSIRKSKITNKVMVPSLFSRSAKKEKTVSGPVRKVVKVATKRSSSVVMKQEDKKSETRPQTMDMFFVTAKKPMQMLWQTRSGFKVMTKEV